MPFAKRALAAGLQVFGARAAIVWPGHVEYPLGLLDGTDGFRVTAESSTGRLGYSVAGVGVSEKRCCKSAAYTCTAVYCVFIYMIHQQQLTHTKHALATSDPHVTLLLGTKCCGGSCT